jgi:hypothetical protein
MRTLPRVSGNGTTGVLALLSYEQNRIEPESLMLEEYWCKINSSCLFSSLQ